MTLEHLTEENKELKLQLKGLENLVHFYESRCDCGAEKAELDALRLRVSELEDVNKDLVSVLKELSLLMRG